MEIKESGLSAPPDEKKDISKTDSVFDFLDAYKEAPKPAETTVTNPANPAQQIPQSQVTANGSTSWVGNPLYYQSGKKAGQLKPLKAKVNVSPTNQPATLSGEILTGALFITLIDLILPILLVGLNNRFSDSKMKVSDLQLNAKQKSELSPLADKVIKQVNIEANPNLLFFMSLIGIYGANFAVVKMSNPNIKQNEKVTNQNSQNQSGQNGISGYR